MNELSIYYSSGSKVEQTFSGQARESIGGIITDIKVPQNLNALFGKVSLKALSEGSDEYRLVYLKNDGASEVIGVQASGTITISNNDNITGDTISVNGTDFVEGVDFNDGGNAHSTANHIAHEINTDLDGIVTAVVNANVITITADNTGVAGNSIALAYTDSGSGVSMTLSGATLSGGVDEVPMANISNLSIYVNKPEVASVTNPADLSPAPQVGDKWIVPSNAEGLWLKLNSELNVNEYEGKVARYDGTGWVFEFAPFADFEFGFQSPIDINIGDTDSVTLTESFVTAIENVFEPPYGIEFFSADTLANILQIGDGNLLVGKKIGMWVKRKIKPFKIQSFDLSIDEGGIVKDEVTPIVFTYDTP